MLFKINTLRSAVERFTGFYTKNGCVETATNIGKELIDMQKSGKIITSQGILNVIKQKAPHIKIPNIATNKDEFISLMQKNGTNELQQAYAAKVIFDDKNLIGLFANYLKGILIKFNNKPQEIPYIVSHEMEHFMEFYCNPKTICKRIFSLTKIKNYLKNQRIKKEIENVINKEAYIKSKLSQIQQNQFDIQEILFDFFAADTRKYAHLSSRIIEGFEPTSKGINEFFKSPIYYGLTSDKRIDAYLRAILRHYFHPLKISQKSLKSLKNYFEKEITAYEVTDNITRYEIGKNGITSGKIRSEIFKRATKILNNEIKIAKSSKKHKKLVHKTGLPTTAVVPEKIT